MATTRDPEFCCVTDECCGVRYFDGDGGIHVQPCKDPSLMGSDVGTVDANAGYGERIGQLTDERVAHSRPSTT